MHRGPARHDARNRESNGQYHKREEAFWGYATRLESFMTGNFRMYMLHEMHSRP